MIKIIISGASGHMGHTLANIIANDTATLTVAGVDRIASNSGDFPIFADALEFTGEADVIVDFSAPAALDALLNAAVERKIPLVLCTTGYSKEQLDKIRETSAKIPLFRSGNMSLGINLVAELIRRAATVLGDGYDVEIVERHHRRKVDAPSGTAILLADAVADALPYTAEYVYDRQPRREPRRPNEIGISAVRGGTIVGDHEIIFAGTDEVIEIRHSAHSRDVFAVGAVAAAKFMSGITTPGLYDMTDVLAGR